MRSGLHIRATSSTQRTNWACWRFPAAVSTSMLLVAIMMNVSGGMKRKCGAERSGGLMRLRSAADRICHGEHSLLFSLTCEHYSSGGSFALDFDPFCPPSATPQPNGHDRYLREPAGKSAPTLLRAKLRPFGNRARSFFLASSTDRQIRHRSGVRGRTWSKVWDPARFQPLIFVIIPLF